MAPARPLRRAAATNENDETSTTRVTRAKAAGLGGPADSLPSAGKKAALQSRRGALQAQSLAADALSRKRTALGDVSNVSKAQSSAETAKDPAKKQSVSIAKAAHPTGVQKASARAGGAASTARATLAPKDRNAAVHDLKRPASVAGAAMGNVTKKRSTLSSAAGSARGSARGDEPAGGAADEENVGPAAAAAPSTTTTTTTTTEAGSAGARIITETIKTTTTKADGTRVEEEVRREERVVDAEAPAAAAAAAAASAARRQKYFEEHIDMMDRDDEMDPLMVGEYVYEIMDYMRELEVSTAPNPRYMDNQHEVKWAARGVLVDWLLEVHIKFHLLPETLYLAVNILDRFLSRKVVTLDRLQLVGVTALFIASKYEEVLSPHIGNFSHVADDGFSDAEILTAERFLLGTLNYDLSYPNPMHFLRRISKADGYDMPTRTMAKFLLEISLVDHHFLEHLPSLNAAAAMYLSRMILGKGDWDEYLVHYSGYAEDELVGCAQRMIDYLQGPVKHDAFFKKYAAKKFFKASLHARAWASKYAGDLSQTSSATTP